MILARIAIVFKRDCKAQPKLLSIPADSKPSDTRSKTNTQFLFLSSDPLSFLLGNQTAKEASAYYQPSLFSARYNPTSLMVNVCWSKSQIQVKPSTIPAHIFTCERCLIKRLSSERYLLLLLLLWLALLAEDIGGQALYLESVC